MDYIKQHWRGNLGLKQSFWLNLVLLSVLIFHLERFTLPPFITGELAVTISVTVFFILTKVVIYGWQIVGTLRACDRALQDGADRYWVISVHGALVLSLVAVLVLSFSSYQALQGYKRQFNPPEYLLITPKYSFSLTNAGTLLHIKGPLESGITSNISRFISKHTGISGLILDSGGGQIAEGRGLARIIKENSYNTFSMGDCMSACTIAFAAGAIRTLGEHARIGFHQYQSFTVYPKFDIEVEQARDIHFFREQGIAEEFLRKMFAHPPEDMWWPSGEELLRAGFVHNTDFILPSDR